MTEETAQAFVPAQYIPDFSSKSQVKDPDFEVSLEQMYPDYGKLLSIYFSPVEKGVPVGSPSGSLLKPSPRLVSVVPSVQYLGRKILHPVPAALRRHNESTTVQSRLPPKKRRYIFPDENDAPASKVVKTAVLGHCETSGFSSYLPYKPIGVKVREARQAENGLTAEDQEVAEIMKNSSVNQYPITGYRVVMLTPDSNITDEEEETDKEIDELYQIIDDLDKGKSWSPKEPWIPNVHFNNSSFAAIEHGDVAKSVTFDRDAVKDVKDSYFQPISPVIISLNSESNISDHSLPISPTDGDDVLSISHLSPVAYSSGTSVGTLSDFTTPVLKENESNSPNDISNVFPSPGSVISNHSHSVSPNDTDDNLSLSQFSPVTISSGTSIGSLSDFTTPTPKENESDSPNNNEDSEVIDLTDSTEVLHESNSIASGKPEKTMAELRKSVLTGKKSKRREIENGMPKSEVEEFAEILEDFLEENYQLPLDIRDEILDMLVNVRATVAKQKIGIPNSGKDMTKLSSEREMVRPSRERISNGLVESGRAADYTILEDELEANYHTTGTSTPADRRRLYDHIDGLFGGGCHTEYLAYQNQKLQTNMEPAFYNLIFSQKPTVTGYTDMTEAFEIVDLTNLC